MTGQEFVKKIGPFGCVLFLLLFAAFLVICFVSGNNKIEGYEPANTSEYYVQREETLEELADEVENNMLSGKVDCHSNGEKVIVTIPEEEYFQIRSSILEYYDEGLFEFKRG